MKKALLIVLTALSALGLVNEAGATDVGLVGSFARVVESAMIGYESATTCEDDGGRWFDGDCVFGTEETVRVSIANDVIRVAIETVGVTANVCEYEGEATLRDPTTLVSSKPTRAWNGSAFVAATCEVAVTALPDGSVRVSNNGKCQMFCGPRATLEIDSAQRR